MGDEGGGGGRLTGRVETCFVGDCLESTVAGDTGFAGAGRGGILVGIRLIGTLVGVGSP